MRERLALLREYLKSRLAFGKNKKTRKGFILTMVALVEVLAISVVSVSAWVETISTITIKAEDAKIDNYVYTNADIGSGEGYSTKTIDLTKYFRAAGGVHLASASSSDGENIFFPIKKSGASEFDAKSYRCADVNDKNVNYIDFSFNVKVDETFNADHAEFYLDKVPKITIGGENVSGNLVRMAITDTDTQKTVVCGSKGSTDNVVNTADGKEVPEKVQAFSDFLVNSDIVPTELFSVDKGSSKTINIKVWLQDDGATTAYAGKTVSITNVNIVTQNKKGNKVYFVDRTVNETTKNWTEDVKFQQGSEEPVTMKFDAKSHTYSYAYKPAAGDTIVKFTSKGVTWTTDMKSLNSGESKSYTAYGDHNNNSNAGYGTWGEVVEISVSSKTADVLPDTNNDLSVYMVPDKSDTNSKVRMPFTTDIKKWVGYIAKEKANNMTFSFTNNGTKYEIPAPNRGNSTLFVVTSATTGYWDPPATITVTVDDKSHGTASIKYNDLDKSTVNVTPMTKIQLSATANPGFAFTGWTDSKGDAVQGIDENGYFIPSKSGTYDFRANFTNVYEFKAYAKTYDGSSLYDNIKGGNVSITCGEKTVSSSITSSSCNLSALKGSTVVYKATVEKGYTFAGWYDDPECRGEAVSNNSEYPMSSVTDSKTLYARFNINVYDVFAKAQYGTSSPNATGGMVSFDNSEYLDSVKTKVNHNGTATFYAKPVENYAFIGWFDKTTDTVPVVKPENCVYDSNGNYYKYETTITDSKTLYARFKALCTVEARAMYNNDNVDTAGTVKVADKEAGKSSSKPVMEGDNVTVEAIAKKGYKFAGWYTDENCSKPYFTKNNEVSSITLNNVKNPITLYAKFELKTDITFYLNDGGLWSGNQAKLAAYVWDDNGNKKWLEVSKTDYDNYYSFALDNNQWKQVIFVRYDPSKNLNDFPTENWNGYVWNKTSDITIDYNNNCYVITSSPNSGGSSTGYWMTYVPGQQNVFREIYVYTDSCTWFNGNDAELAYKFSDSDSYKSDCTKVTKDEKTYWKLSIPTDKDTIYLSRAVSGKYYNEFSTSIDNSKNLFEVNGNFNGGSWKTYQ
uniref:InlB B-repeat-containing protein n=1 Tax=Ruminococcus bromii TaxID=40518 RepID=UPI003FEEA7C4